LASLVFSDYTASVRTYLHRFLLMMLALPMQNFASVARHAGA
jgi:hypothetical protein